MSEAITATIGWSTKADSTRAGKEAAEMALTRLAPQRPRLAVMFGSSWFDQAALLEGVRAVVGDTPLIGGSTAGEITPAGPLSHSCVLMLLASESLTCSVGFGEDVDLQPREAGQQAAYAAMQGFRGSARVGFLFVGDGLLTGYADAVRGIQEVVGTSSLVVGGLAADDLRFTQTFQYCNDRVISRGIAGVLFGGSARLGVGIEHGFAPISKPRQITRARANVLIELDHRPAASVYEEYFGPEFVERLHAQLVARERIAYPIGIQCEAPNQWLLRNILSFDDQGSLVCNAEILEGSWLQLMIGSRELALEAARRAAQQAIRPLNRVVAALVFDCVGRCVLLGPQHAAQEIAMIQQTIGPSVPCIGCYTYGEQAPLGINSLYGRTAVQTGSVLVVALGT